MANVKVTETMVRNNRRMQAQRALDTIFKHSECGPGSDLRRVYNNLSKPALETIISIAKSYERVMDTLLAAAVSKGVEDAEKSKWFIKTYTKEVGVNLEFFVKLLDSDNISNDMGEVLKEELERSRPEPVKD